MTSESLNDSSYEIINHDEDGIKFSLPFVNDNVEGWGPNNVPEKYKDLPYQKFSKSDRIGKVIQKETFLLRVANVHNDKFLFTRT
jgi:hypothetical protein